MSYWILYKYWLLHRASSLSNMDFSVLQPHQTHQSMWKKDSVQYNGSHIPPSFHSPLPGNSSRWPRLKRGRAFPSFSQNHQHSSLRILPRLSSPNVRCPMRINLYLNTMITVLETLWYCTYVTQHKFNAHVENLSACIALLCLLCNIFLSDLLMKYRSSTWVLVKFEVFREKYLNME